jgi:hypothetical protein
LDVPLKLSISLVGGTGHWRLEAKKKTARASARLVEVRWWARAYNLHPRSRRSALQLLRRRRGMTSKELPADGLEMAPD